MKKTISVSLGGLSFTLEDDAYGRLEAYLNKIKAHFASYGDAEEIVSDIEARLGEQLMLAPGANKIVTLVDIEKLVAVMGEPEQFGGEAGAQQNNAGAAQQSQAVGKRLFRNPDDVIIAGVASGLAAYFGIDSFWVRLAFGLSVLVGGFGVAVYIILWIVVPEAKTETEKMQMRGERVNLANIEQLVKERIEEAKAKDRSGLKSNVAGAAVAVGGAVGGLGRGIRKLIKFFVMLTLKIVGLGLTIGAAGAVVGLIVAAVSLLLNANSNFVDFPFRELAHGWLYYVTIVSAFFVAFVPTIYILMVGTSLLSGKSTFKSRASFSLLGLWILAVAVAVNGAFTFVPQVQAIIHTSPYFQTTTRELDLKDFTKLDLSGATEATIHTSDTFKVVAEGTQHDLDANRISVRNGTLVTDHDDNFEFCLFCHIKRLKLDIYAPALEEIAASGASRVSGSAQMLSGHSGFKLKLSGASSADMEIQADNLNLDLSGASRATFGGTIPVVQASLSGASRIMASAAKIKIVTADLSGASRAQFGDLESLKATASGASTVLYASAGSVEQHLSGASKVVKYEDPVMAKPGEPEMPQAPQAPIEPYPAN